MSFELVRGESRCFMAWPYIVRNDESPGSVSTRSGLKIPMGQLVLWSSARSARISPIILANLKPWPEQGEARTICGASG